MIACALRDGGRVEDVTRGTHLTTVGPRTDTSCDPRGVPSFAGRFDGCHQCSSAGLPLPSQCRGRESNPHAPIGGT